VCRTMTSEAEIEMESPPLFDYLRQSIPMDELLDYASPKRIRSIDFVKGLAIIMIMMAHISEAWLDNDWLYKQGIFKRVNYYVHRGDNEFGGVKPSCL